VKNNSVCGSKGRSVQVHMTCGDIEPVILYGQQREIWVWHNDIDTARVPINSLDRFRTEHAVM
jgi:hypothetical protein